MQTKLDYLLIGSRQDNQKIRILNLLINNDFVPTAQLRLFAYQYNARIKELRQLGYNIVSCRQDGKFGFRLNKEEGE